MIEWTDELKSQYKTIFIIALAMVVFAPIVYIFVAFQLDKPVLSGGQFDIMFYILLFLSMIQPTVNPLIEKFQISIYKKNPKSSLVNVQERKTPFGGTSPQKGTPMGLFMTVTIIKLAIVEAIYVYGMVVFFTSGDMTRMFYFYPIGIAWTLVYFPTKEKCIKFLEKVSSNAIA